MIEIIVSVIEAPFTLFEMQIKGMIRHTVELLQPSFGKAPKAFDAIDVACSDRKLIAAVIDSKVFGIAEIHQSVITTPVVVVDHHFGSHTTPYNRLQTGFGAVRHNLGMTRPLRLRRPKTGVLPEAPRPRLPLTRRAPK